MSAWPSTTTGRSGGHLLQESTDLVTPLGSWGQTRSRAAWRAEPPRCGPATSGSAKERDALAQAADRSRAPRERLPLPARDRLARSVARHGHTDLRARHVPAQTADPE